MTTEEKFRKKFTELADSLWDLFYLTEDTEQRKIITQMGTLLAELEPEEV